MKCASAFSIQHSAFSPSPRSAVSRISGKGLASVEVGKEVRVAVFGLDKDFPEAQLFGVVADFLVFGHGDLAVQEVALGACRHGAILAHERYGHVCAEIVIKDFQDAEAVSDFSGQD